MLAALRPVRPCGDWYRPRPADHPDLPPRTARWTPGCGPRPWRWSLYRSAGICGFPAEFLADGSWDPSALCPAWSPPGGWHTSPAAGSGSSRDWSPDRWRQSPPRPCRPGWTHGENRRFSARPAPGSGDPQGRTPGPARPGSSRAPGWHASGWDPLPPLAGSGGTDHRQSPDSKWSRPEIPVARCDGNRRCGESAPGSAILDPERHARDGTAVCSSWYSFTWFRQCGWSAPLSVPSLASWSLLRAQIQNLSR